jgi:hypothetical protein
MTASPAGVPRPSPGLAKAFRRGLAVVIVVLAGLGALVGTVGTGRDRPSGVAASWLGAVSETTRSGVHADAVRRTEALGPVVLARPLIPPGTDGHAAFSDYQVGRAAVSGDVARVPYLLHQHGRSGAQGTRAGTIVLRQEAGAWRVAALLPPVPGLRVPSEGGPPAVSISLGAWLGAAGAAAVIAVVANVLVWWAARAGARPASVVGTP